MLTRTHTCAQSDLKQTVTLTNIHGSVHSYTHIHIHAHSHTCAYAHTHKQTYTHKLT